MFVEVFWRGFGIGSLGFVGVFESEYCVCNCGCVFVYV